MLIILIEVVVLACFIGWINRKQQLYKLMKQLEAALAKAANEADENNYAELYYKWAEVKWNYVKAWMWTWFSLALFSLLLLGLCMFIFH